MPLEGNARSEEIQVVFVDRALVVLDKPAGLLAVPGRGSDKQDCLSSRVQRHFADALVVHRLDMSTSGLMLMARGMASQRILSEAFAQRLVEKQYVAVVQGQVRAPPDGTTMIDLPIIVDWPHRPRRMIAAQGGQPSLTRLKLLEFEPDRGVSRVQLEPLTGRTHQLRVHLMAIGHPILGDMLYAPGAVQAMADRLLLHACALTFTHPEQGAELQFKSEPDF
jgi:tRNA pseudouridine32 synthase/23S rRNA pseudouridine746 synthase